MLLYLLRHAEAVDREEEQPDADRVLTEKGIGQARRVGKFCVREGIIPDLVLTSPFSRARATANIVADELDVDVQVEMFLSAGMNPDTALEELQAWCRFASVMIVGHEPDFSHLCGVLLGIQKSGGIWLRKASLTGIEIPRMAPGCGELHFSLPVRLMR